MARARVTSEWGQRPVRPVTAGILCDRIDRKQTKGEGVMKKLIFAVAAASTMLATPALADTNWQGKTYGQDAWGVYQVSSTVTSFCKFGTDNSGGQGVNGSADTNYLNGAQEGDGSFSLNIQNTSDDTVQAANATYNIAYAVCNSPFTMQLSSNNGGLKASQTTSDGAFIENVPYNVKFAFDGNHANANSSDIVGFQTITAVDEARAGPASVEVLVNPHDKLLLEGTYSDILQARLSPNLGS
jgi:hypothetical protein